jgi:hypothetical protein
MSPPGDRYALPLLVMLLCSCFAGCKEQVNDLARVMTVQQLISTRYQIEQVGVVVRGDELEIVLQNSRYNRLGGDVQLGLARRVARLARETTESDPSWRDRLSSITVEFLAHSSAAGGIVTSTRNMGSYTFKVEELDRAARPDQASSPK